MITDTRHLAHIVTATAVAVGNPDVVEAGAIGNKLLSRGEIAANSPCEHAQILVMKGASAWGARDGRQVAVIDLTGVADSDIGDAMRAAGWRLAPGGQYDEVDQGYWIADVVQVEA